MSASEVEEVVVVEVLASRSRAILVRCLLLLPRAALLAELLEL